MAKGKNLEGLLETKIKLLSDQGVAKFTLYWLFAEATTLYWRSKRPALPTLR